MARVTYIVAKQDDAWTVSVDDERVGYATRAAAMKALVASAESANLHGDEVVVTIMDPAPGAPTWLQAAAV